MTPAPLLPIPGTPYWVSAGAFSEGDVYLDACDDDPLINDPAAGNASDSYYLPLLQQPERTLTPTYTPTLHPGCYLTLSTQSAVNVREYPTAGTIVGQILTSDPPTRVLGISMQLMDDAYWYLVYREEGWDVPEIQSGWSSGAVVELQDTYECELLNEFDVTVTPIVALPTHTPSMPPPQSYSPTPTFGVSPSPTATPTRVPRIVETQAKPFHDRADQFGLPLPFAFWPVVELDVFQNGYGPNWFSASRRAECDEIPVPTATPGGPTPTLAPYCPYRNVNSIHPDVDYYTRPESSAVVALCDGIIVPGRMEPSGDRPYGGSAFNAWGLTLRCFADDPADPDGDGKRNLSNIIVVYNHLNLDKGIAVEDPPGDGWYQIVYAGQPIATSDASGTESVHLDLQLYIADGHRSQDAMQLNPRFMNHGAGFVDIYGVPRTEKEQGQYPLDYNQWSLQGRIEGAGRGQIHFWTNPSAAPFLYDAEAYLSTLYPAPTLYVGPNCQNLPAGIDIDQAWWEGPNVILECEIIGGLGDV